MVLFKSFLLTTIWIQLCQEVTINIVMYWLMSLQCQWKLPSCFLSLLRNCLFYLSKKSKMLPIADDIGYVWTCPMCGRSWMNGHICIQMNEQGDATCFHWRCRGQFLFQKPINLFRQWQHFVWCCNPFELSRLTHLKKNVKQKYLGQILFWPVFHSNLMNPKGLDDIWVRLKVGPERQVHSWYRWVQFL